MKYCLSLRGIACSLVALAGTLACSSAPSTEADAGRDPGSDAATIDARVADAAPALDATSLDAAVAVCGDSTRQEGESCDDGNRMSGDGCSATCATESFGWQAVAGSIPRRYGHAVAWDSRRERLVVFGGEQDPGFLDDTWEWDRTQWRPVATASKPGPRRYHAMTYDAQRGVVVLFGGNGVPFIAGDTWEYDGTTWTERTPTTSPPARWGASLAYDPVRGVSVLFGGTGLRGAYADTWEWDGSEWTEVAIDPAMRPPARVFGRMVWHAAAREMILIGGEDSQASTSGSRDVWAFDRARWTARTVEGMSPFGRHAMAYDAARSTTVLFGPYGIDNDWAYVEVMGTTARAIELPVSLTGRAEADAAYVPGVGVVLVGGRHFGSSYTVHDDAWVLGWH